MCLVLRFMAAIAVLFLTDHLPTCAADETPPVQQMAEGILTATGVQGGILVHLGCGDGRLTAALRASDAFTIHGLDRDPVLVEAAREHIAKLGLYGPVSVEHWTGPTLPYADNLVNLIVVSGPLSVDRNELLRVLCPGGIAYPLHH